MNKLKINGTQEFMGTEVPIIYGGFGENCKDVLAKTVADIHGVELRDINKLINNNLKEFEFGIDILDLKQDTDFAVVAKNSGLYSQNALNASTNIYLLSEQGYMALAGLMKTDKAREVRKEFRRNYFSMVETIQNALSEVDMKILNIIHADSDISRALAIKDFSDCVTLPLRNEVDKYERFLGDKLQAFTKGELAIKLDTNTSTLAVLLKKLHIYTQKKCQVSEEFTSKFPNIKMIMEVNTPYFDTYAQEQKVKKDWQWTFEGAKTLIDYLISLGKVTYCDNSGFKLLK